MLMWRDEYLCACKLSEQTGRREPVTSRTNWLNSTQRGQSLIELVWLWEEVIGWQLEGRVTEHVPQSVDIVQREPEDVGERVPYRCGKGGESNGPSRGVQQDEWGETCHSGEKIPQMNIFELCVQFLIEAT